MSVYDAPVKTTYTYDFEVEGLDLAAIRERLQNEKRSPVQERLERAKAKDLPRKPVPQHRPRLTVGDGLVRYMVEVGQPSPATPSPRSPTSSGWNAGSKRTPVRGPSATKPWRSWSSHRRAEKRQVGKTEHAPRSSR